MRVGGGMKSFILSYPVLIGLGGGGKDSDMQFFYFVSPLPVINDWSLKGSGDKGAGIQMIKIIDNTLLNIEVLH